ncbi:hypothetical protein QTO17_19075, partial [Vibrio owensii]
RCKKFDRQVKINTGSICFVTGSVDKTYGRNLPNSKYEFANTTSQQRSQLIHKWNQAVQARVAG